MSGPFDQFNNMAWPSTPTSPPSAPAGYATPAQKPNIALKQPPLTPEQVTASRNGFWDLTFQRLLQAFTGAFLPGNGQPFQQMEQWAQNIGADFRALLTNLGQDTAETLAHWMMWSASGRMATRISKSAIADDSAQMLFNPNFSGAISLQGQGIWSWDDTVYFLPPGQTVDNPGSAMVTANAAQQGLVSNPSNEFVLDRPIIYSIELLSNGVTGTGTLFQLWAVPWINQTAQDPVLIEECGPLTGSTSGWTNPPAGSVAGRLSGSYTPDDNSGVTSVYMMPIVTASATAGTVWLSAASEELTGGVIDDLQNDALAKEQARAAYQLAVKAAADNYTDWPTYVAARDAAKQAYEAVVSNITADKVLSLHDLLNAELGIGASGKSRGIRDFFDKLVGAGNDPTNSQVQSGSVASALGNDSIGTDVTNTKTWLATKLNVDLVMLDELHLIYQKGSPDDTWGTLGTNGKPTWYSAVNEHKILVGEVNSEAAPTDAAPTTGDVIAANTAAANTASTNASTAIATNQSVIDQVNQAMTGDPTSGQAVATVFPNMTNIPNTNIIGNLGSPVTSGTAGAGGANTQNNNTTVTWHHTPDAADITVEAIVWSSYNQDASNNSTSCSYDGQAMAKVATYNYGFLGIGQAQFGLLCEVWRLGIIPAQNPTQKTVQAYTSANAITRVTGNSISYYGQKISSYRFFAGEVAAGTHALTWDYVSNSNRRLLFGVGQIVDSGSTNQIAAYSSGASGSPGTNLWQAAGSPQINAVMMDAPGLGGGATIPFNATLSIGSSATGRCLAVIAELTN